MSTVILQIAYFDLKTSSPTIPPIIVMLPLVAAVVLVLSLLMSLVFSFYQPRSDRPRVMPCCARSSGEIAPHMDKKRSPSSSWTPVQPTSSISVKFVPPSAAPLSARASSKRGCIVQSNSQAAFSILLGCSEERREARSTLKRIPTSYPLKRIPLSSTLPASFTTLDDLCHRSAGASAHKRHATCCSCQHCWQHALALQPIKLTALPVHWDGGRGRGIWDRPTYDSWSSLQEGGWPRRVGPSAAAMGLPGVRAAWGLSSGAVDGVPLTTVATPIPMVGFGPATPGSAEGHVGFVEAEVMKTEATVFGDAVDVSRGNVSPRGERDLRSTIAGYPRYDAQEDGHGYQDEDVVGADDSGYAEHNSTESESQAGSTEKDSSGTASPEAPEAKPRRKTARGCRSGKKVKEKREQRRQEEDRRKLLARRLLPESQIADTRTYPTAGRTLSPPVAGHGPPERPSPVCPPRQTPPRWRHSPHRPSP
ncbi:hypothetical protein IAR50_001092 [Cryptococcus sp. DSM 104548]